MKGEECGEGEGEAVVCLDDPSSMHNRLAHSAPTNPLLEHANRGAISNTLQYSQKSFHRSGNNFRSQFENYIRTSIIYRLGGLHYFEA